MTIETNRRTQSMSETIPMKRAIRDFRILHAQCALEATGEVVDAGKAHKIEVTPL